MAETSSAAAVSLLDDGDIAGSVDHRGQPALRSSSGGWRSAAFIIAVEVAERFAYYGISSNLITYLTGPLGQSTAAAAENVNAWSGTGTLLPVVGAIVADSFLGRYTTIIVASVIYASGLGLLTLSAALTISNCGNSNSSVSPCSSSATKLQEILFFISLYMVAIGQGGHKPCAQAFGADQFDELHSKEKKDRSSFFNWWYCSMAIGINVALLVVVYVQDNLSWAVGFAIPCFTMLASLVTFILGRSTYRFSIRRKEDRNPFLRIGRVIIRAVRRSCSSSSKESGIVTCEEGKAYLLSNHSSQQFKFLNEALFVPGHGSMDEDQGGRLLQGCSVSDVEETKQMLRLFPIWVFSLGYAVVFAQTATFFTKQGYTLDRTIFPNFQIPPASLQFFIGTGIIIFVPVYDRLLVPIMASITGKPRGITMLQRIGTGMFLSLLSMVIAATVETKRLRTEHHNEPTMSIWWLVPQYVICGISDVFTIVGLQEFFYEEVPTELKSLGLSFYLGVLGVGSFLSSFIVSLVDEITGGRRRRSSWFDDDLNKAHLDYYYWLLAVLSGVWFVGFLCSARTYVYRLN
ncbi:Protein NRT1/ PTR FAMILY 5.13 [Linum perenne]